MLHAHKNKNECRKPPTLYRPDEQLHLNSQKNLPPLNSSPSLNDMLITNIGKSEFSHKKSWFQQLSSNAKQVLSEKEGAIWMQNPNKRSNPRLLDHQPQLKDERKRK
ncbi:hypothetical protein ACTXT7_000066 [Hymenolepis weldensis]